MASARLLALVAFVAGVDAHGPGVWRDPGHYVSDSSLAGLRFIAEINHNLMMIGTEDGANWWYLKGFCSGPGMTQITFDFSPKGGPSKLTGTWSTDGETQTIVWPDGNAWTTTAPTTAFEVTVQDTYWGLFIDNAHAASGTFAGVRVIAETPQHTLRMIGSDDGKTWWYLEGICHDVNDNLRPMFKFDFSPKGGPKDLEAWWDHNKIIKFPDGNVWKKPPYTDDVKPYALSAPPVSSRVPSLLHGPLYLAAAALVAIVAQVAYVRHKLGNGVSLI